jgi:ABC-type nitrate/sulfonate/bicarbonate transport system substrate-binding protein
MIRRAIFTAMGRSALAAAAFVSGALLVPAQAQETQKLTVSIGRLPWGALNSPISTHMMRHKMVEAEAKQLGYELTIDWRDYPSAAPQVEAMQAGRLDLGVWGNVPIVRNIATGQPIHVLALAEGRLNFQVAVPKGSNIRSIEDLKGKRIGTLLGGDPHFFLAMLLKAHFGNADPAAHGITMIQSPSFTMLASMPKGLDAVTLITPAFLLGREQGTLDGLVDNFGRTGEAYDGPLGKGPNLPVASVKKSEFYPEGYYLHRTMWVGRGEFIKQHPKVIVAFLTALNRATEQVAKMDPGAVSDLAKEYWKLAPAQGSVIVKDDLLFTRGWTWLTEGDLRSLVANSRFMKEAKLLPNELSWDDLIKNIQPIAPLAREAWGRSKKHPAPEVFTEKSDDLRGAVMWDYERFTKK